jgi:hypothetical protein
MQLDMQDDAVSDDAFAGEPTPKSRRRGRICAEPACQVRVSKYNDGDHCSPQLSAGDTPRAGRQGSS